MNEGERELLTIVAGGALIGTVIGGGIGALVDGWTAILLGAGIGLVVGTGVGVLCVFALILAVTHILLDVILDIWLEAVVY